MVDPQEFVRQLVCVHVDFLGGLVMIENFVLYYLDEIQRFDVEDQKKMFRKCRPRHPPERHEDVCKLDSFSSEVEIILQTVNENEYQAAVTFIKSPFKKGDNGYVFPSAGTVVGIFAGHKTALIQTDVGGNSADYIYDAISRFPKAKFVIAVGVAFAFDKKKYKFGDVLVSTKISDLKNFKFDKKGGVVNRGEIISVCKTLTSIFCKDLSFDEEFQVTADKEPGAKEEAKAIVNAEGADEQTQEDSDSEDTDQFSVGGVPEEDNEAEEENELEEENESEDNQVEENEAKANPKPKKCRYSKVYAGTYASCPILMDNKSQRDKFRDAVPEVIGGEMEGGELLRFQKNRQIEGVIVIKGVVDYGDGTKAKGWQFTAAMAAFTYVKTKLQYYCPSE